MWLDELNTQLQSNLGEPIPTVQRLLVLKAQHLLLLALLSGLGLTSTDHELVVWQSLSAEDYAVVMERTVFNTLLSETPQLLYCRRVRQLVANLKRNAPRLLQYDPSYLALASMDELGQGLPPAMERAQVIAARRKFIKDMAEERVRLINSDYVGAYQCRACRGWKTTYYQMQTRSADEPMTIFVTCLQCGKRHKE